MKRVWTPGGLLSALSLVVTLLPASCSRSVPGTFPYDAAVVDPKGVHSTLTSVHGVPMVVVAYVASMPDCRERIRRFVALSDGFRIPRLRFVAVDIGIGPPAKFPEVLPPDRGNVQFFDDRDGDVRRALRIDITPTTFLVSADGKIRDRIEALYTWDSPEFHRRLERFVGGS